MNQTLAFLAYVQLLADLVTSGKTSLTKLRVWLTTEGATPEQFAAMDTRLTSAIDAREGERPKAPQ